MGARASEAVQVSNPPNVRIHLAYFCEGELYGELLKHLGRTMHDPDGLCVFAPWRESKESRYDGECHCLTQSREDGLYTKENFCHCRYRVTKGRGSPSLDGETLVSSAEL